MGDTALAIIVVLFVVILHDMTDEDGIQLCWSQDSMWECKSFRLVFDGDRERSNERD